jgi:hypothetical protein
MEKSIFKKEIIFAGLLLISYFLPWISLDFISFSGYQIPEIAKGISDIGNIFKSKTVDDNSETLYLAYSLYLIPILSVATIVAGLIGSAFIYCLIQYGNVFKISSIGMYSTVISAITLIISSLTSTAKQIPYPSHQNLENQISSARQSQIRPAIQQQPHQKTSDDDGKPTLEEWMKSNPGKSINDYYLKFGDPSN